MRKRFFYNTLAFLFVVLFLSLLSSSAFAGYWRHVKIDKIRSYDTLASSYGRDKGIAYRLYFHYTDTGYQTQCEVSQGTDISMLKDYPEADVFINVYDGLPHCALIEVDEQVPGWLWIGLGGLTGTLAGFMIFTWWTRLM